MTCAVCVGDVPPESVQRVPVAPRPRALTCPPPAALPPGADHHPVHRLPGPHLLLLLRVPGREGRRERVGQRRVWQLRRCPLVGGGKSGPLGEAVPWGATQPLSLGLGRGGAGKSPCGPSGSGFWRFYASSVGTPSPNAGNPVWAELGVRRPARRLLWGGRGCGHGAQCSGVRRAQDGPQWAGAMQRAQQVLVQAAGGKCGYVGAF